MGPLITILSIRVALLLFALALLGWALRLESSSTGGKAWRRRLRWAWTIGFGFFGIHVLSAFHFYHGWSHQAAVDDTARQTGELLGWRFGEGLYFSYLFLILWGVDALVRWRSPQEFRPRWLVALGDHRRGGRPRSATRRPLAARRGVSG